MNFLKKCARVCAIKKLERKIAFDYSHSIQEFLTTPVISILDSHLVRVNEIKQKLNENRLKRDKLANSRLWGNQFCAHGFYDGGDELESELKKRSAKTHEIYDSLGFEITTETLNKLKREVDLYSKQKLILDNSLREEIALGNTLPPDTERQVVQASLIISALGVGFHAGASFNQSMMVYEALRRVNSNFAELGNDDIWFEMMLLKLIKPDSYLGMVNLVKGAYFEQLVANDTGGILHEHFNAPETDMILHGTLVQLKATGSNAVINNITPETKVIATSEVAENTPAIDSGYSNEEITSTTERALGGDVFNTSSSLIDGTISLFGGIGVLASLKGISAAGEYLEKSPNKLANTDLEDLEESFVKLTNASYIGLEVAVISTWNTLPFVWNIILNIVRWGLNIIHITLYPFIKAFS